MSTAQLQDTARGGGPGSTVPVPADLTSRSGSRAAKDSIARILMWTAFALAVIPLMFLVQLAFIVAFGVLLDATVVRALLIPALVEDIGAKVWWPSKLTKKP